MCVWLCICVFVFFFKQKTAYEMRISDWSSDVCSSDLLNYAAALRAADVLVRAEAAGTEIHVTVGGLRQPTPFSMHTEDAVRMCGVLYQQSSGKGEFNPTSWQRSSIAKDRLRSLGVDARITSARLQFNPAPEGVHAFIRLGDQRSLAGISFEGYR